MNAFKIIRDEIAKIGYSAIEKDYVFSDVFAASGVDREANLAAFTHTPPSYRNAAIAVVDGDNAKGRDFATEFRALGAPLLFVVEHSCVTVWQVRSSTTPKQVARVAHDQIPELFASNVDHWNPLSIQRAKSIGQFDPQYQLDFIDLGLLPAIEGQLHPKLDRLLNEALAEAINMQTGRPRYVTEHVLFSIVFRFLAAKILKDRSHRLATQWDASRIETVLSAIATYYGLPAVPLQKGSPEYRIFSAVWQRLLGGINFQNISSEDLAFVYENTLVTEDIRARFGTHSTPRQVAEYVVRNLRLHEHDPEDLQVYEPFAGAAVLLVSALRHVRDLLPINWTDQQRHNFLIKHLAADEIDSFACEVAMLSLILADYPNHNGWHINKTDLFEKNVLSTKMRASNVIVCNPPFEAFTPHDRRRYPVVGSAPTKAVAVLSAALDAHPVALGFVLPRAFILEQQFAKQRSRVEKLYGSVELVEVPERIFRFSTVASALLIAREPRHGSTRTISLRSTEIAEENRTNFLDRGEPVTTREVVRVVADNPSGDLWIPQFEGLWRYLEKYPRLQTKLSSSWGLQWTYQQENACSPVPRDGFRKGVHNAARAKKTGGAVLKQFASPKPVWLDYRERYVRRGFDQTWSEPKLILNASRLSRGPWRIAAFADFDGLLYSQQFYGMRPVGSVSRLQLLALSAVLNGPVANAYIAVHSPAERFRISALDKIPIPARIPEEVGEMVSDYMLRLKKPALFEDGATLELLQRIDASVLKAYDLPPRLERELLDYFRGANRPVGHEWHHWFPEQYEPFIPLHEYLSERYRIATRPWLQEVFTPLPPDEAARLRELMD
jgi:hypothetical protein